MNIPQKAIKKPIPVEFIQLTTNNMFSVHLFITGKKPYEYELTSASDAFDSYSDKCIRQGFIPLKTLESGQGTQNADFGDYILKGIDGECWPVKPSVFERTYDII